MYDYIRILIYNTINTMPPVKQKKPKYAYRSKYLCTYLKKKSVN